MSGVFGHNPGVEKRTLTSESQPSSQAQVIVSANDASRLVYDARASRIAPEDVLRILGPYEAHALKRGCVALRSSITQRCSSEYPSIFCSLAGLRDDEEWEVAGIVINPGDRSRGELPSILISGVGFAFRSRCEEIIRNGDWIGLRDPIDGRVSNLAGQEGIPENAVLPEVCRIDYMSATHEMDSMVEKIQDAFLTACRTAGVGGLTSHFRQMGYRWAYHELAVNCLMRSRGSVVAAVAQAWGDISNITAPAVPAAGAEHTRVVGAGASQPPGVRQDALATIRATVIARAVGPADTPERVFGTAFNLFREAAAVCRIGVSYDVSDEGIDAVARLLGVTPFKTAVLTYATAVVALRMRTAGLAPGLPTIADARVLECGVTPARPGGVIRNADVTRVYNELRAYDASVTSGRVNDERLVEEYRAMTGVAFAPDTLYRLAGMPEADRINSAEFWTRARHDNLKTLLEEAVKKIAEQTRSGMMARYAWYVASRMGFPNQFWIATPEPAIIDGVTRAVTASWKGRMVKYMDTDSRRENAGAFSALGNVLSDQIVTRFAIEQTEFHRKRTIGMCMGQSHVRDTIVDVLVSQK